MFLSVASNYGIVKAREWVECSRFLGVPGSVAVETISASPTDPGTET